MIQIAVCDDIPAYTLHFMSLLERYQKERPGIELELHSFDSGDAMLESIQRDERFDIYMLDVIMPDTDGITLAREIRQRDEDVPIVFFTQSASFALDAYGVSAVQYILKPVETEVLFPIMDKVISSLSREADKFMIVSAPGRTLTVLYSSIVVVEHARRSLRVHLESGEYIESKTIRTPFGIAVSALLDDRRFLWVQQSYVINMAQVKELHSRIFVMKNKMEISIPRPKYAAVKRKYLDFLKRTTS